VTITLFALSGACIAVSSGVMAVVMFAVGRSKLHVLWGVFCVSVFTWGLGGYFIGSAHDPAVAEEWWRFAHVGVAFIPVVFFHFVTVFLRQRRATTIAILYGTATAFSALALWSNLLIAHMRLVFGAFYYDSPPGALYILFTAYFFGLTIISHVLLYRAYRSSTASEIDRTRIKYFFLGMAISFTGGSLCFLPVYGIDIYPITNFAVVIYPIIVGYAILRHQLFDIRVATAQGLTFLLWMFVAVRVVLSSTRQELILNGILFLCVVVLGVFLVRSVSREIDARRRIEAQERQLEKINDDLAEANRRQESLIHLLSHEVKGYFAKGAGAFGALASGDYGPLDPDARKLAAASLEEMRHGINTVMDILQAGDFKKGTVTFNKAPFDLREAVAQVVAEFKVAAADKGLSLSFEADDGHYMVCGDRAKLSKHVVANLIDNAIKYTPVGFVHVSLSQDNCKVLLAVRDTGIGIAPEDRERLFSEGGRGLHATAVNPQSTGYGLYIARSVVEAHGGRLWVTSSGPENGSIFYAELPEAARMASRHSLLSLRIKG
jgi:signal transduction histidine kinase